MKVEPSGYPKVDEIPPPVVATPDATLAATAAWVKYCRVAITPVTAAKSSTGEIIGRVT